VKKEITTKKCDEKHFQNPVVPNFSRAGYTEIIPEPNNHQILICIEKLFVDQLSRYKGPLVSGPWTILWESLA
jgi:hypothetical protein